jgi:hypothetical protein
MSASVHCTPLGRAVERGCRWPWWLLARPLFGRDARRDWGKIHANSALCRLEDLIGEVSQTVPQRPIASAINLVVFLKRIAAAPGRVVSEIPRCCKEVEMSPC